MPGGFILKNLQKWCGVSKTFELIWSLQVWNQINTLQLNNAVKHTN